MTNRPEPTEEQALVPEPAEVPEPGDPALSRVVEQTFKTFRASMGVSSPLDTLAEKLTSEHITQLLDGTAEEGKRDHEDRTSSRRHQTGIILVALIIGPGLVVLFGIREQTDFLIGLISALGGLGAGWGIGRSQR